MTDLIERMARAMYEANEFGGTWEPTPREIKESFRKRACAALGALVPEGDAMAAAVDAVERLWTEMAHRGISVGTLERETVQAAAPLLRAPVVAELERVKEQLRMANIDAIVNESRANDAERERDAARAEGAKLREALQHEMSCAICADGTCADCDVCETRTLLTPSAS